MLKLLAILTVILTIQIFPLQIHGVTQAASHSNEARSDKQPLTPSIISNVDNRKSCNKCEQEYSISAHDPGKYTRWGFWANVALTVITFGLAVAAIFQAKAANRQAKHIVASERAWIVVRPETEEDWKVNFFAVNGGKTPARILSINGVIHPVRRGEEELRIDWDSLNESSMSTPPEFLPPDAKCVAFSTDISKIGGFESRDRIALELIFYGKIRYLSVLESKPKIHETRWRYWYLAVKGAVPTPDPHHIKDNDWN